MSIINKIKPIELNSKFTKKVCDIGHLDAAQLRLYLGVTALGTKSSIDYLTNKKLDKDTRKYSLIKTIAKIVIGTTTGVLVRKAGLEIGKKLTSKACKNFRIAVPYTKQADKKVFIEGVSNSLAFVATVISTICLDVPLINKVLSQVGKKPKSENKQMDEVA